jgi:hypothetical protein
VILTKAYRLTLGKSNGALVELVDRSNGARLVHGPQIGCQWGAVLGPGESYLGGCLFGRRLLDRFSYVWDRRTATLTMRYQGNDTADRALDVVVTLKAAVRWIDLSVAVANRRGPVVEGVYFPADLRGDAASVTSGYATNVLPGVRLGPGFFEREGESVFTYPSRWAFADYLSVDTAGSHLALYALASPAVHPVALGFVRKPATDACPGAIYCVTHMFHTWIPPGGSWSSPVLRLRVGGAVAGSIRAFRNDSGIEAYPSLEQKLGERLATLARAPLVKIDVPRGVGPFLGWDAGLRRLPSPSLVHPVAFQPGGHDGSNPDYLPPDPRWGTTAELAAAFDRARALGHPVMPYLNPTWWPDDSPTVARSPVPDELAVHDRAGAPLIERYSGRAGYIVSPFAPGVRDRFGALMAEWRNAVPSDCLFFDQLGARTWQRDFNPASPTPLAYYDGWLGLLAPFTDRCLMVEDGWDRLAEVSAGFHGSLLLMAREHGDPDRYWGEGNWEPFPLALWLFHDKVLLYQHDLAAETMTTDAEVLTWNMAFGTMLSFIWAGPPETLADPWLDLAGSLQRALGPSYAGRPLTAYAKLAPDVTETVFDRLTVTANHGPDAYELEGFGIAADGFLARTADGNVLAGAFEGSFADEPLSPGVHYLIVSREPDAVTVEQPLGPPTTVFVAPPASWRRGSTLRATAFDASGTQLGTAEGRLQAGRFAFHYGRELAGARVAAYRVALG